MKIRNPLSIVQVCCPGCKDWMESRSENKTPKHPPRGGVTGSSCSGSGEKPIGTAK